MPLNRLVRATFGLPRRQHALAPPGGRLFGAALVALGLGLITVAAAPMLVGAQTATASCLPQPCDPGVRGGPAGAGGPLPGLSTGESNFFSAGKTRFTEIDSVSGTISGEGGVGLGPRFNMNECGGCHAQPSIGGSSPFQNPQMSVARDKLACTTTTPCNPEPLDFTFVPNGNVAFAQPFISETGPVREARFVDVPGSSTPDGGVHDLFTISGRSDAGSCGIAQPDFGTQNTNHNLVARIPTPTYGAGLIANIRDAAIINNQFANSSLKSSLGISGHANREGNAGTITRFGWKAQNKSGQIFSGEAYLVEQGVTSEVFPNERGEPGERPVADDGQRVEPPPACLLNALPEDHTNFGTSAPTDAMSDVQGFSVFMQFLNAPQPACQVNVNCSASINNGATLFGTVHCDMCHTPTLETGPSSLTAALSRKPVNLFSDLLVHNMGSELADGVSQGSAAGDEFRTAPLWGVGQRIFFLHDGRTRDMLLAIEEHASAGSEANGVIALFNGLTASQQQDVINYLRSL